MILCCASVAHLLTIRCCGERIIVLLDVLNSFLVFTSQIPQLDFGLRYRKGDWQYDQNKYTLVTDCRQPSAKEAEVA